MGITILTACPVILAALGFAALGLLLVTAAVNCRAEDEYWERFWTETPTACLGASDSERVEDTEIPFELRIAA